MSLSFVKLNSERGFGWLSTSLKGTTHLCFYCSSDENTLPVFDLIGILLLVSVPVKFITILNNVLESFQDAVCSLFEIYFLASFCIDLTTSFNCSVGGSIVLIKSTFIG